jgi:thiol-disulfide isomerase/thioredoxin
MNRENWQKTMKNFIRAIFLLWLAGSLFSVAPRADNEQDWYTTGDAGEPVIHLHFFWSIHCPHCHRARPFIEQLAAQHAWLRLHSYELIKHPDNVGRFIELARSTGQDAQSVPAFIFCRQTVVGFDDEQGIGAFLRDQLHDCRQRLLAHRQLPAAAETGGEPPLSLPLLGAVDTSLLSLPLLTVFIAALDAFNPCAFFVLLFLLSLLVHARSRGRMLLIGGIFVLFSGLVYFVFMAAWFNIFRLLGELKLLTLIAGLLAIAIAAINIKDYFWFKAGVSLSIPERARPGLFARMRRLVGADRLPAMLLGSVVLALVANSYELLCTAGFPMVYTRVLTLNELDTTTYYLYLAAYNAIYIIPLALIVLVFTWTLGARRLSEREGRILKLMSGLMMLGLGLVLVVMPAFLNNILVALGLLIFALAGTALIAALSTHGKTV